MKDIVVVKTGGKAASDMAAMEALFREMPSYWCMAAGQSFPA